MITDEQRTQVVRICDELGYGITEENVAATTEPVQNFINACIEYRNIDNDVIEGLPVTTIIASQRQKGESHKDLVIVDYGTFRAVKD